MDTYLKKIMINNNVSMVTEWLNAREIYTDIYTAFCLLDIQCAEANIYRVPVVQHTKLFTFSHITSCTCANTLFLSAKHSGVQGQCPVGDIERCQRTSRKVKKI